MKVGVKLVIYFIDVYICFSYMICNNFVVLYYGNLIVLVYDYVKSFLKKVVCFFIF